jgi:hypothetical protein
MYNTNDQIDLSKDIEKARRELSRPVGRLNGALQLWNIMTAAQRMAAAFVEDLDKLRYETRMAYSKGIVVEYWRPWSGNEENSDLQSVAESKELRPVTRSNLHEALHQLRNGVVAHADQSYEGRGIELTGMTLINDRPDLHPRTLADVFVPVTVTISSRRSLWWLNDRQRLSQIVHHITRAQELSATLIRRLAVELRDQSLQHIHVLKELSDLFSLKGFEVVAPGRAVADGPGSAPEAIRVTEPTPLKIGDDNVQSLITIYKPSPQLPDLELKGNGFTIKLTPGTEHGNLDARVSFPSRKPCE